MSVVGMGAKLPLSQSLASATSPRCTVSKITSGVYRAWMNARAPSPLLPGHSLANLSATSKLIPRLD
eukprot:5396380-Lingulodinium_polyedra.AAC.1